jgi:SAM-dependent methyltransferase
MHLRQLPTKVAEAVLFEADPAGPHGLKKVSVPLHRRLFERGVTPPWVLSAERCRTFWATRPSDGADNSPNEYAGKLASIVDTLDRFWRPEIDGRSSVFEVGTNAGANLHRLQELGYTDLAGLEISAEAVAFMGRAFPDLNTGRVRVGPAEAVLPDLPERSVDVLFSMAVLMHVHPSSSRVFDEMARVGRYVCTVEAEEAFATYVFPRNYRRVFEARGLRQLRSVRLTREANPEVGHEYFGYTLRLFGR